MHRDVFNVTIFGASGWPRGLCIMSDGLWFDTSLFFVGILVDRTSLDGDHSHILCTLPFQLDIIVIVHEDVVYVKVF